MPESSFASILLTIKGNTYVLRSIEFTPVLEELVMDKGVVVCEESSLVGGDHFVVSNINKKVVRGGGCRVMRT